MKAKKKTTKKAKSASLSKTQFMNVMINEIKLVNEKVSPYQAFILIANLDGFCKNELGVMLFKEQIINKAFAQMRNFYSPQRSLWLTNKETSRIKHMKNYKGLLVLEIKKTIAAIEKKITGKDFGKKEFLSIR